MKALVLCGGIPQIALMQELKSRGITTLLADMNEHVIGRKYCDFFYPISVLDVDKIKELAAKEKVDFIITVCADQVLQVMAEVSEELKLPCYIDFATAECVSKKSYMKKVFVENSIPTAQYLILNEFNHNKIASLKFPLIVKPVDSYSSKGVRKVDNLEQTKLAFSEARNISRTSSVIVEEFVNGDELTVDVYVEEGNAKVLCISNIEKIPEGDRFVIYRTQYPADITNVLKQKIESIAQNIADAFKLKNSPMLIQMIYDGEDVSVVEFCARTGGGDKFRLIEKVSNFDVIKAIVDLTLGNKPHVEHYDEKPKYIVDEFLYCNRGVLDHLEGFEKMIKDGIITEYYQLKTKGTVMEDIKSSGDRVAYFCIEDDDKSRLLEKHHFANKHLKVLDSNGKDLLRHDLLDSFN